MKNKLKFFLNGIKKKLNISFYKNYNYSIFFTKLTVFFKNIPYIFFSLNLKKYKEHLKSHLYLKFKKIFFIQHKIIELIKRKKLYSCLITAFLLILSYFSIYLPTIILIKKKFEYKTINSIFYKTNLKLSNLNINLKKKIDENKNNEMEFKHLKDSILKNQFKDILEVKKYIKSHADKYDLIINSIGEPLIKTVNITSQSNDVSSPPNPSDIITKVIIIYDLSAPFDNLYNFIKNIENNSQSLKITNGVFEFSYLNNKLIRTTLNIEASVSILSNDNKISSIPFLNTDKEIKNLKFSKIENAPLRLLIDSIKLFPLIDKTYLILTLKNGKKLLLKNNQKFKENNQYFKISISKFNNESYKIILENTISGETVELKEKI